MAMKNYTGWQWLLIDAANQFGLDKLIFEERIQWAEKHLDVLESMADQADVIPLYKKAVMAIRRAQQRIPTGHLVGVDAACSGIQIMSVMTGCVAGATATGLVNPDVRADAYTATTAAMNVILGGTLNVSRKQAKDALMTTMYGSKAKPKEIFGLDTPELNAFYEAANQVAPGAWELLQDLLGSWQPYALEHSWKLPDGYDARIKVMQKKEARIEVDELDHATFTYEFFENIGSKTGLANAANVVHSMDAWVLRSMHRRCNYDKDMVIKAAGLLEIALIERSMGVLPTGNATGKLAYYMEQYQRSTIVDVVILPYLTMENIHALSTQHLQKLMEIVQSMLTYEPFELVTVHDEFRSHPNNVNKVRFQYKEIMADIADSNVLSDILSQIHGVLGHFTKLSNNLGNMVRQSSYALC